MEQQLVLALSLFLVSVCTARAWPAPDFCHGKQCPEYKLVKKAEVGAMAVFAHIGLLSLSSVSRKTACLFVISAGL